MPDVLQSLIDKQDTSEIVRDQIAAILKAESANQEALATAGGEDPTLWALDVFIERANPWESYRDATAPVPIINVWLESVTYPQGRGDVVKRQQATGIFNIDCYGFGLSEQTAGGHEPGDKKAATEAQRIARLVRNILMASSNTYLQLRGVVAGRWPQNLTLFQPQSSDRPVEGVVGARIALEVSFNEFSPQYEGAELATIATALTLDPSGQVVAATYQYP